MKGIKALVLSFLFFCATRPFCQGSFLEKVEIKMQLPKKAAYKQVDKSFFDSIKSRLKKYTLKNGFEVVLLKDTRIPKVFMGVGYRVGSAHETSKTRGMAHLLEHMIFKGTKKISESDIWRICSKYGADANAFTFTDGTFYHFEVDKANWRPFLDILADCSQNLRCDGQHLASELKAVVQELKMGRDSVDRVACKNICSSLFPANHPYFHPTIGYIQELAAMDSKALFEFYKAHYRPKNATILVVGDFDQEEMEAAIKESFGSIPDTGEREQAFFPPVIKAPVKTETIIYHEVGVPTVYLSAVIPGLKNRRGSMLGDLCASLLANEHGGRLKTLLVDKLQIAHSVLAFSYSLINDGVLVINFSAEQENVENCSKIIFQELSKLSEQEIDQSEINLCKAMLQNAVVSSIASYKDLGVNMFFEVLGSKDFAPQVVFDDYNNIGGFDSKDVQSFFKEFINPLFLTKITILPITPEIAPIALLAQDQFRKEEEKILQNHIRTVPLEGARLALELGEPKKVEFSFPKPTKTFKLKNGIEVIAIERDSLPQASCLIWSKNAQWIDGSLDGNVLFDIANSLLLENSVGYTKEESVNIFNSLGAEVGFGSKGVTLEVTQPNFQQAFNHLVYVLSNPEFRDLDLKKIVEQNISVYKSFNKSPEKLTARIKQSLLYKETDFQWTFDQAIEKCKGLDLDQVKSSWKEFVAPENLVVVCAGALPEGLQELFEKSLGSLVDQRTEKVERKVPAMITVGQERVEKVLANDQKRVLLVRSNSLKIGDPRLTKLALLNTIVLSGAGSKLFALREATGLFYTANGGFGVGANALNSSDFIVTIVNPSNVNKFINMVWEMFQKSIAQGIDPNLLSGAKQTVLNELISKIGSNGSLCKAMFYLHNNNLEFDYYDKVLKIVQDATPQDLVALAEQYCTSEGWATIEVGGTV